MKIALLTLVKNELFYIKEWVQYHLAMGFDLIFVVEDFGSKSHSFVECDKCEVIKLETIFNPKNFSRHSVLKDLANYFAIRLKKLYDWMAYIDADEYIMSYRDLHDVLNEHLDSVGLRMLWRNYNANGHFNRPEGGTLLNYTEECKIFAKDWDLWEMKSIGNLSKYPKWKDPHRLEEYDRTDEIWVNHYICRSFQDYCYKIYSRGDVYHRIYRRFDDFLIINPTFKREDLESYVINVYKNLKEYVQVGEDVIDGVLPQKTTGKSISLFPDTIKLSLAGLRCWVTIYATDDCGEIMIDDPFGLYDVEKNGSCLKIHANYFEGGPGIEHKVRIHGKNGGSDYLTIIRHGFDKRYKTLLDNNQRR